MHHRIQKILNGRQGNYVMPLFWQHSEEEVVLREEMARIDASGIGAVTIPSGGATWTSSWIKRACGRGGCGCGCLTMCASPPALATDGYAICIRTIKKRYLAEGHIGCYPAVVQAEVGLTLERITRYGCLHD